MLLDTNLLLYAVDDTSPWHEASSAWLTAALNGPRRIALPWQTLGGFLRVATSPRVYARPMSGPEAWTYVQSWLDAPSAWIPPVSRRTAAAYEVLTTAHQVTGNLVPDAMLAALALEHGLTVCSADTDFARFPEIRWVNPLAA